MPTSVLLAILAGAGLLALAPALVRRYDADERLAAELEESQARVLERKSANASRSSDQDDPVEGDPDAAAPVDSALADSAPPDTDDDPDSATPRERTEPVETASVPLTPAPVGTEGPDKEVSVASARLRAWWRKRYRRVLYVLLALNLVELVGVVVIGPGFWFGVAISVTLLVLFLRFLRMRAIRESGARGGSAGSGRTGGTGTAREPKSIVAKERQVYVPSQSERDDESADVEPETGGDDPAGLVPGFDPEPDDAGEPAPSRRRTGGIRGRSYESPANLLSTVPPDPT